MKKFRTAALALAAVMALSLMLSACGSKKNEAVNVPVSDIWDKIAEKVELPSMMDMDETVLSDLYYIDAADLADYVGKMPMMNVHATEFFIAKVNDGKMETVKAAIEKRHEDLIAQWEMYLPAQLELVQNAKIVENGNYILFAIAQDVENVVSIFDELTK